MRFTPTPPWAPKRSAKSTSRDCGERGAGDSPRKAARSVADTSLPRTLASPTNQGRVSGTGVISGNGSTSPAASRRNRKPAAPPPIPTPTPQPTGANLSHQFSRVDGLEQIILRALAQAPEAVGVLVLAAAQDHRDVLGRLVARDGPRRLETARARHDHVHQDKVRRLAPGDRK